MNTRPSRIWLKPQSDYTATSINPHHPHSCRTSMRIRAPGGAEVIVVEPIAGLLARRMVCDVPVGDKLSIGGTYGLIWFGSRLDNYQPAGTDPLVRIGQCAVAGETTLAELS